MKTREEVEEIVGSIALVASFGLALAGGAVVGAAVVGWALLGAARRAIGGQR